MGNKANGTILLLNKDNEKKEMDFELQYLLSLTIKERFLLMLKKSREMRNMLEQNGHRKTAGILKRKFGETAVYFPCLDDMIRMKKAAGRAKDLEDLKYLRKIRKQKK